MKDGSSAPAEKDLCRLRSPWEYFVSKKACIEAYYNSHDSWQTCVRKLKAAEVAGSKDNTDDSLLLCAVIIKHQCYSGIRRLSQNDKLAATKVRDDAARDVLELLMHFGNSNEAIRKQLIYALCGLIINFCDIKANEKEFLLIESMDVLHNHPNITCELLHALPHDILNQNISASVYTRACVVRSCVMYAPRIFLRLFGILKETPLDKLSEPLEALVAWLDMHKQLITDFKGTNEYIFSDDVTFDHDSILAKIPRDDGVLLKNSLNSFGAIGGVFELFKWLKGAIGADKTRISNLVCTALTTFYSLTQFNLPRMMYETSMRCQDVQEYPYGKQWYMCSKATVANIPPIVTDSCRWAMDFFCELHQIFDFGNNYTTGNKFEITVHCKLSNMYFQESSVLIMRGIMELLVTIAVEHIPYALLFTEDIALKAISICYFVKDMIHYPDMACRKLCLDFYTNLFGVMFTLQRYMKGDQLTECILHIVQTMRHIYTTFFCQLINTCRLDLRVNDVCQLDQYRNMVLAFMDDSMHITGVHVVVQAFVDQLLQLELNFDWSEAELCSFLLQAVVHRITPKMIDAEIENFLTLVCDHKSLCRIYTTHSETYALFVHRSISNCLVLTCGLIAENKTLLKAAQEFCMVNFKEKRYMYEQHSARALRSLLLSSKCNVTEVYQLLRQLAIMITSQDCPLASRVELLGSISDLISTFTEGIKMKLKRDLVSSMSLRLKRMLENKNEILNPDEVTLYILVLCIIDFQPDLELEKVLQGAEKDGTFLKDNHEILILDRIKHMAMFWNHVDVCHNAIEVNDSTPEDYVENIGRWLLWVVTEAADGSSSQFLAISTILSSGRVTNTNGLVNESVKLLYQHMATLIDDMFSNIDTKWLDFDTGLQDPGINISIDITTNGNIMSTNKSFHLDGINKDAQLPDIHKLDTMVKLDRVKMESVNTTNPNESQPGSELNLDNITKQKELDINLNLFNQSDSDTGKTDSPRSVKSSTNRRSPRSKNSESGSGNTTPRRNTRRIKETMANESDTDQSKSNITLNSESDDSSGNLTNVPEWYVTRLTKMNKDIKLNVDRFRSKNDFFTLKELLRAIANGIRNRYVSMEILSWPKFSQYLTVIAMTLPTINPMLNRLVIDVFLAIVLHLDNEDTEPIYETRLIAEDEWYNLY
uniref:Uncharacterized protein n=1 Tax=Babesia bovis TaxID=5865 RepID=A7AN19_BABBO|eukprot:XP_001611521.1 hypothetical protein [Babesia bovis T2Bo]